MMVARGATATATADSSAALRNDKKRTGNGNRNGNCNGNCNRNCNRRFLRCAAE